MEPESVNHGVAMNGKEARRKSRTRRKRVRGRSVRRRAKKSIGRRHRDCNHCA